MSVGRHSARTWRKRVPLIIGIVILVLGVLTAGSAYAAYRYEESKSDRVLPGVQVAGTDIGNMTREQATTTVGDVTQKWLSQKLTMTAGGERWVSTPADLGMTASVGSAVDGALAVSDSYSWVSRAYHRISDTPVEASFTVDYTFNKLVSEKFVKKVAGSVFREPVDAAIMIGKDGGLVFRRSKPGSELDAAQAVRDIRLALNQHLGTAELPLKRVPPGVPNKDLGKTIVVSISKNMLYLYDGFKIEKSYPVATAAPGYETPLGSWHVINKVENPTWINPAPNGWGAGEPAQILPGPGNPLGTRALYLDAPGIRIHGTPDSSSIGSYASHGCIRMFISDSEDLYPRVPMGIPALIIR